MDLATYRKLRALGVRPGHMGNIRPPLPAIDWTNDTATIEVGGYQVKLEIKPDDMPIEWSEDCVDWTGNYECDPGPTGNDRRTTGEYCVYSRYRQSGDVHVTLGESEDKLYRYFRTTEKLGRAESRDRAREQAQSRLAYAVKRLNGDVATYGIVATVEAYDVDDSCWGLETDAYDVARGDGINDMAYDVARGAVAQIASTPAWVGEATLV